MSGPRSFFNSEMLHRQECGHAYQTQNYQEHDETERYDGQNTAELEIVFHVPDTAAERRFVPVGNGSFNLDREHIHEVGKEK